MENIKTIEEFNKTQTEIENLKREIFELKDKFAFHKHSNYDGSQTINSLIRLPGEVFFIAGNTCQVGITRNQGKSNESNRHFLLAGGEGSNTYNSTQLMLENQPGTTGGTNQSFYYAFRPPIWQNGGISITSGTNTFTDNKRNWAVNSLINAYVNLTNSTGVFKETRKITANTATQITVDANFTFTDSNSTYHIFMPVYLGGADFPWRRIYTMEDIRFGRGTSGGTDVIFIKFGSGTPEGAITANVGSLYLRTNGGANTTLYVKESGNGANTGWIAK